MEDYAFPVFFFFSFSSGTGMEQLEMGVGEHRVGKGIPRQKDGRLKDGENSCSCWCCLLNKRQEVQPEVVGGTLTAPLGSLLIPNLCWEKWPEK